MHVREREAQGGLASGEQVGMFDRVAERYAAYHDENLRLAGGDSAYFYEKKVDLIRERIRYVPRRVLDYGCGIGRLTRLLAEAFPQAEVHGVDPSTRSIGIARETCAECSNVILRTTLGDRDGDFDMAVAAGVFHHIPRRSLLGNMAAIAERLARHAAFFVFEHNPVSPALRLLLWLKQCDKGAKLVSPWRMRRLLMRTGFENVRCEFISFFPASFGPLLRLERHMSSIPCGAQYLVWGTMF